MCTVMDSFSKCVFVRAGKHPSVTLEYGIKIIIGKHINNIERKMSFSIKHAIVTDNQIIDDNELNLFVSIGPMLALEFSSDVNPLSNVNYVVNSSVISTITTLEVWHIVSSIKNSSPGWDNIPAVFAKKCIEYYINPLTHILSNSIKEGVFPSELKLARVVPLLKSDDSRQITNYYPISSLSFFSKIFEIIMYNHVVDFMDSNCSIYKHQFVFRQRYSTQQAIIISVKNTSSLDDGDLVNGVFLDLKRLLILLIIEYY